MKSSLIAVAVVALFGLGTAQAQVANPDNDSANFFAYRGAVAAVKPAVGLAKTGDVSSDGLYIYANPERGWTARGHDYIIAGGVLAHAADCLPYDLPKAAFGGTAVIQSGPFADRGA